jgi:hypothetical protein
MGIDGMDRMARDQFRGASPRVFGTNPDDPESGRIFIWTPMGWFERLEGPWGNVTFTPVADDEDQLREWLSRDHQDLDLVELDENEDIGKTVCEEFLENIEQPLYPEAPENSSEGPFEEQDVT